MTGRASILRCAGQVLVAGFPGVSPPETLLAAVRRGELGGVILFRRNLETPAQAAELIGRCTAQAPGEFPLLVAVDQEGGRVSRRPSPEALQGVLEDPEVRLIEELMAAAEET